MDFRIGRRTFLADAGAMIVALRSSAEVALAQEAFCGEVTTFPVPSGDAPHDAVPSPDGMSAWYTAQAQGALGILTVSDGKVTKVPLGDGSAPHGVIAGPDGAAWITDGGRDEIIRVDAMTLKVTRFPTGLTDASLNTAAFDKAGALWFTGQNGYVGRLDPNSGAMSTTQSPKGRGPYGICATPAGNVWYSSLAGTYLGHVTFANDAISIKIAEPPTAGAGNRRVWSDSKGRLWTSEWNVGQIGLYDPTPKSWQEWKLPGDKPQTYAVFVDDKDRVWVSDFGSNSIFVFDEQSATFQTVTLPDNPANVRQLSGRPGELWGAESAADKIVRVKTDCA